MPPLQGWCLVLVVCPRGGMEEELAAPVSSPLGRLMLQI